MFKTPSTKYILLELIVSEKMSISEKIQISVISIIKKSSKKSASWALKLYLTLSVESVSDHGWINWGNLSRICVESL